MNEVTSESVFSSSTSRVFRAAAFWWPWSGPSLQVLKAGTCISAAAGSRWTCRWLNRGSDRAAGRRTPDSALLYPFPGTRRYKTYCKFYNYFSYYFFLPFPTTRLLQPDLSFLSFPHRLDEEVSCTGTSPNRIKARVPCTASLTTFGW